MPAWPAAVYNEKQNENKTEKAAPVKTKTENILNDTLLCTVFCDFN